MIRSSLLIAASFSISFQVVAQDEKHVLDTFDRTQLTDIYFSEGAAIGDLNADGKADIVYGPYWWEGPEFAKRQQIYQVVPQDRNRYADHFFAWVHDVNGDGFGDVLTAGFPGTPAFVYENPGPDGHDDHWPRHQVLSQVSNEAPQFVDVTGDGQPELVCTFDGHYGFAEINTDNPLGEWTFTKVSESVAPKPFGHGLGVGDVNGDGRQDILANTGWYEQPAATEEVRNAARDLPFSPESGEKVPVGRMRGPLGEQFVSLRQADTAPTAQHEKIRTNASVFPLTRPSGTLSPSPSALGNHVALGERGSDPVSAAQQLWTFHKFAFASPGGADMFAYDIDGDGDNDVVTSIHAHEFGVAWYEQIRDDDGEITFSQHMLVGKTKADSPYGILFTEPHCVKLADIDGDGLQDIVTGKTYWSHHTQSTMWDAGAVVYWFRLTRGDDGSVDFVPYLADDDSGVGRGMAIGDVTGDELPDIVSGGMKGAYLLTHMRTEVSHEQWEAAQPQRRKDLAAGLEPQAAAEHMTAPAGFKVEVAAAEPDVHQPIAMAWDHRGRLWLAEAFTYPQRAPEGQGKDRILILEDTTGDGLFDKTTTFTEGLNLVSGLEVGFGGVWVGAAPYLLFIPDVDGDDKPDAEPQILLDGFGYEDTHETLNAFIWGPDGWLYGCHGVFTHSLVGKPGTPDDQRVGLNCGVWRYHPLGHKFEVFAHGTSNPWGVDFDEHGQAFITACVIPHLWHMIHGARYQRQGGRHFNPNTYDDIKTIADHQHYVGNIRDHAWWGHEPQAPNATLEKGGGHAHCGAMIYLGDNWPEQYRGHIFFNNIHGNRVNCDVLERDRSGFVGHHGDDLLLANDKWFRGINLRYGPDGSVYLIDWYDPNACHRNNPEIWDRTNGRVYRVSYVGSAPAADDASEPRAVRPRATTPGTALVSAPGPVSVEASDARPLTRHGSRLDLSEASANELVALHDHANEWFVRMARKELQYRMGQKDPQSGDRARAQLWKVVTNPERSVANRLRALWTIHVLGGPSEQQTLTLLNDEAEYLRAWAIQLELEDGEASSRVLTRFVAAANHDPSPVVRLYLASALQRLPLGQRWDIADALAQHAGDLDDHNIPLVTWYGIEPLVDADPAKAMELARRARIPLLRDFLIRRAASQPETIGYAIALLSDATDAADQHRVLDEVLAAIQGQADVPMPDSWGAAYDKLSESADQSLTDKADRLAVLFGDSRVFGKLRAIVADDAAPVDRRVKSLDVLVRGEDRETGLVLLSDAVLGNKELQGPAVRALATLGNDATPTKLLAAFPRVSEKTQADIIGTLISRADWTEQLLAKIGEGTVPRTSLHAYHVRQILAFEREDLAKTLTDVWGEIRSTTAERQAQIEDWKKRLTPEALTQANRGHGRLLFSKMCGNCHQLFGEGGKIGPDITGSNRANLDYILENVFDPSAVVGRDYRMTTVLLEDGRVVSGMLKDETDSALTVQTINDVVVIPKRQIEDRTLSNTSMMPERQLDPLPEEHVRNLIAYLGSPNQVGISGPPAQIVESTGKVPGALEGESLKIVEKTGGTAAAQDMAAFKADRWSGNSQLWWTGARPGDRLSLAVGVEEAGTHELELVLTKARDYGIVKLYFDDKAIGSELDLYDPQVITTGVLSFQLGDVSAGEHKLTMEIVGANPEAAKAFMVGVDFAHARPAQNESVD